MSKHRKHHHGEESPETRGVNGETTHDTSVLARVNSAIATTTSTVSNAIPTRNDVRNLFAIATNAVQENPIGALLGGLAIGILAGSLLPKTPVEDDRLGALKDTLQTHAQAVGAQALEHGKAVIRDTIEAAQQSAQQHGAELAEDVRASV